MKKIVFNLLNTYSFVVFILALATIFTELRQYSFSQLVESIKQIPLSKVFLSFLFALLSYALLTIYENSALEYIGHKLNFLKVALVSFIDDAFSNNIGFSTLSAASIQYHLYSKWGLTSKEITKVVGFIFFTSWLGYFTLAGATFLIEPISIPQILNIPLKSIRPVGIVLLIPVISYFLLCCLRKNPIHFKKLAISIPTLSLSFKVTLISFLDWILCGASLYSILPDTNIRFPAFLAVYLLAEMAGFLSRVPSGFGVVETIILVIMSSKVAPSEILVSLLVFRIIYNLMPLITASILFGLREFLEISEKVNHHAK